MIYYERRQINLDEELDFFKLIERFFLFVAIFRIGE